MQQTNFRIQLVVGEDCSTDGTREIVKELAAKYPDRIHALLPEQNLGVFRNWGQVHAACEGEYIAMLDGDDYFIDPHKLQKQADFLDENPDVSLCFHPVQVVYEDDPDQSFERAPKQRAYPIDAPSLMKYGMVLDSCSMLFRASPSVRLTEAFANTIIVDHVIAVLSAREGRIEGLQDVMSAYRKHGGGRWSSAREITRSKMQLEATKGLLTLMPEFAPEIRERLSRITMNLVRQYSALGKPTETFQWAMAFIKYGGIKTLGDLRKIGRLLYYSGPGYRSNRFAQQVVDEDIGR